MTSPAPPKALEISPKQSLPMAADRPTSCLLCFQKQQRQEASLRYLIDEKRQLSPLRNWVYQIPFESCIVVALCCESFSVLLYLNEHHKSLILALILSEQSSIHLYLHTSTQEELRNCHTPQVSPAHCPLLLRPPQLSPPPRGLSAPGLASFHPLLYFSTQDGLR